MQAVIYAVRDFLPRLRSWVVRLMCDNAVTVAYIKNEGGAPDHTLWCRWPYDCSSGATARRLRWFPSIFQECTTSRRIPCPESARHWPRSGRWSWRVYDPCLPSGASYGSTCLRHLPTDDSSSSYRHIRTPGRSGQMSCPCLGTRGGTFLYAFPSFKMVPQVLLKIAQSPGVEVILIAQLQPAASWFPELMDLSQEDPIPMFVEGQDLLTQDVWTGDGVTENVTSDRVETLQAILRAKGHSREAANMMSRCRRESSQQVYESHWSRFVAFCRTKRWQVFRVRSHHFSTYMMHLFRDGLLPSTLISYRTSVASVLRHWVYNPAADPYIKLLVRAFRLERPVQRRIMSKWDLNLVLLLLRPPFISQVEVHVKSSDDVIPLKWRTLNVCSC